MKKVMISILAGASVLSLVACAPKRYERKVNQRQQRHHRLKKKRRIRVKSIIKRFWSGMLSMIQLLKMAISQACLRN